MKLLLSAYACEPNRGSEPGVGWEWAMRLAERHEVTVITRANNREEIESALGKRPECTRPRFIYIDLPKFWVYLKKRRILPVPIYYIFWQLAARFEVRHKLKNFDLVHHVTFNGFRFPGAWWRTDTPVVLGPLGGGSVTASAYRRCFGRRWPMESLRGWSVQLWKFNPWTLCSLFGSDAVIAVGAEMAKRFASLGIKADSMLETAVPSLLEAEAAEISGEKRSDFLLVGNLEPWKGWQIAFEAFAQALLNGLSNQRLAVIGTGSQIQEARKLASSLNIDSQVDFLGQVSRHDSWQYVRKCRALIFPSIRDTSGNAVIEAMALSTPVICFNHQGVAWMTDNSCAFRISPQDWDTSINHFSNAILALADNDELVESMGKHGRKRAIDEFSWETKINQAETIYQRVVKHKLAPKSSI